MKLVVNGLDLSQRYTYASISGRRTVCARTLTVPIAVSELEKNLSLPTIPYHAPVLFSDDEGQVLFEGVVVYYNRDSAGSVLTLKAMDYGYYLANNDGWYNFRCTPEAALRQISGDYGIPLGSVATTGVSVSRKFGGSGVKLHNIIDTMYSKASERTGKQYHIRFNRRALSVVEKPESSEIILAPKVNVQTSSHTVDVSSYTNTVDIRRETGTVIRTLGGGEELAGVLRRSIVQRNGEDAGPEAKKLLEEGQGTQTVAVECFGDTRLVTGNAVVVRETSAGVAGLFWIDADTHTWKEGQYTCSLDLNFRNLMNETAAGTEE